MELLGWMWSSEIYSSVSCDHACLHICKKVLISYDNFNNIIDIPQFEHHFYNLLTSTNRYSLSAYLILQLVQIDHTKMVIDVANAFTGRRNYKVNVTKNGLHTKEFVLSDKPSLTTFQILHLTQCRNYTVTLFDTGVTAMLSMKSGKLIWKTYLILFDALSSFLRSHLHFEPTEPAPLTTVNIENDGFARQRLFLPKRNCSQILVVSSRTRSQLTFTVLATVTDGTGKSCGH